MLPEDFLPCEKTFLIGEAEALDLTDERQPESTLLGDLDALY